MSESILRTNNLLIAFFTVFSGLGALLGIKGFFDQRNLQSKHDELKKDHSMLSREIEEASLKAAELAKQIGLMTYLKEIRDPNPDVRIRAIQKLGQSNDVAAISTLVERYGRETVVKNKLEIIYWLADLLGLESELGSQEMGFSLLVGAANERNVSIRMEALAGILRLCKGGFIVPRYAVQKLSALSKTTDKDVKKLAKEVLDRVRKGQ